MLPPTTELKMSRTATESTVATKTTRWAMIQPGDQIVSFQGVVFTVVSRHRPVDSGWTTFGYSDGQSAVVRGSWTVEKVVG